MRKVTLTEPLALQQGQTFDQTWLCEDSEGNPVPFAGVKVKSWFRARAGAPALLKLSTEDSTITTEDGKIVFHFTKEMTQKLTQYAGVMDVFLVYSDGRTQALVKRPWALDRAITWV